MSAFKKTLKIKNDDENALKHSNSIFAKDLQSESK
jgi:hypothetical protein